MEEDEEMYDEIGEVTDDIEATGKDNISGYEVPVSHDDECHQEYSNITSDTMTSQGDDLDLMTLQCDVIDLMTPQGDALDFMTPLGDVLDLMTPLGDVFDFMTTHGDDLDLMPPSE